MKPVESATTFLQKKWHINKRSLDKQSSITRVIIIHDKWVFLKADHTIDKKPVY